MEETLTISNSPNLGSIRMPSGPVASPAATSLAVDDGEGTMSKVVRYGVVILLLAFLGFNLFGALGDFTERLRAFLAPVLGSLGFNIGQTVKQTVNVGAEGAKGAVDIAAGTVDTAIDMLEEGVGRKGKTMNRIDNDPPMPKRGPPMDLLNKAVVVSEPEPDESGSSTQRSSVPKSGYCFIGEDRGFRSCIKVENADKCMSGDIFPSRDICVNPNLRA
jgi:hypothetical protein